MKKIFSNIICLLLLTNAAWAQSAASVLTDMNFPAIAENVDAPMGNIDLSEMYFGQIEIAAVKGVNSRKLDFAPTLTDEGMVFTSSRKKVGATIAAESTIIAKITHNFCFCDFVTTSLLID